MKRNTVASKKYIKAYKNYPKFKPKPKPIIGCVYYGDNRLNNPKLGILIEMGTKISILKTKDDKKIKVKTYTLKSAQIGK